MGRDGRALTGAVIGLMMIALLPISIPVPTLAGIGYDDAGLLPLSPLPLELPTVAGLLEPPRLRMRMEMGSLPLGRLSIEELAVAEGETPARPPLPLPLPLPPPPPLSEAEAAKLDPLLRLILEHDRLARARGSALDLARFTPLVGVYSPEGPLAPAPPPIPTEMSEFIAPIPAPGRGPGPESEAEVEVPGPTGVRADRLGVLVRTRAGSVDLSAAGEGVEVITTAGEVVVARVTLDGLRRLARLPEVVYIEAGWRLAPELDRSVPAIGADRLHLGEPPLRGEGVLIGSVDTGVDYEHLDFRADEDGDGFEERSRILYIWDQTQTETESGSGSGDGDRDRDRPFGTEYTRAEIEAELAGGQELALVRQRDESGHGTHLLGIAAGDGSSSQAGYVGVAPEAELIVVKTTFYTGDVVAGVDYIFSKARELERPCVVSLGLGGHFGPHDGTSNLDLALVSLLGPGQVIVVSAGNEGDERVHISGELRYPGDALQFDFLPAEETVYLNFWYPGEAGFALELETPVTATRGLSQVVRAAPGELVIQETPAGTVSIDNASGGPNPNNGDKQIGVLLEGVKPGQPWRLRLIAEYGSGRFDGWPGLASMGEFPQGDSELTISEPGDAEGLITVGAYTTRYEWRSITGGEYHFRGASPAGQIAPFSSRGPTRDGRRKPDLAAPGTAIISSLARGSELAGLPELCAPDGVHAVSQGSSLAAAHVAGTVALMLQAGAEAGVHLYPEEIAEKLREAAGEWADTEEDLPEPELVWGAGRLDAALGVQLIRLSLPEAGARPEIRASANPASERIYFTYSVPPGAEEVKLIIYSVVGKPVFTAALDPQRERFAWDLVDDEGEPLPNGLYIYVIIADGVRSKLHRLVIRR